MISKQDHSSSIVFSKAEWKQIRLRPEKSIKIPLHNAAENKHPQARSRYRQAYLQFSTVDQKPNFRGAIQLLISLLDAQFNRFEIARLIHTQVFEVKHFFQTYCSWILRYVKFHGGKTHPLKMGKTHIEAFLSHLATHEKVAAATQRQALNALVFLYREVVFRPIEGEIAAVRAKRQVRVPVGTTREEVRRMLSFMSRTHLLMAKLMYGSGLRLMECVRLRVLDLDFGKVLVYVRGAKSGKDRVSLLPTGLHGELENHMNTNLLALSSPLDYLPGPLNGVALRMSGTPGSSMCV